MIDFDQLLSLVSRDFPSIKFKSDTRFAWSPATNSVQYNYSGVSTDSYSLLHELSHALLGHSNYTRDFELIRIETEAWNQARLLARKYEISIDQDYIQDCIDTYREWLHSRSRCPQCNNSGVQIEPNHNYKCTNCGQIWQVSNSRLCRSYRSTSEH